MAEKAVHTMVIQAVPTQELTVPAGTECLSVALRKSKLYAGQENEVEVEELVLSCARPIDSGPTVVRTITMKSDGMEITGDEGKFLNSVEAPNSDVMLQVWVSDET